MKIAFLGAGLAAGVTALATMAAAETPVLKVLTYDSFATEWGPGPAVEKAFEADCACDLQFVTAGDGAALLSRIQMEGAASEADIVLGLDTNLTAAATAEGVTMCGDSQGGMFGFFLFDELPQNYAKVMTTDGPTFNTLFHGLLDRGVYIAPALYEAGFVSAAHTAQDIADTVAAARDVFKLLGK